MTRAWIAAVAGLVFTAGMVQAQQYQLKDLTIVHPWARPTAGPNKMGAAYLAIKNSGRESDTLESASTPDAKKAEIHETTNANGVMKMRPVEGGLKIAPGQTVEFKPGGYHIMLMGLKQNLKEGEQIPLKLTFAHAGSVDVEVKIEKQPGHEAAGQHSAMH